MVRFAKTVSLMGMLHLWLRYMWSQTITVLSPKAHHVRRCRSQEVLAFCGAHAAKLGTPVAPGLLICPRPTSSHLLARDAVCV